MKFTLAMTIGALILCTIPTQSTSKYEGVSWNEEKKRWQVELDFSGKKCKYYYENELDAIKTRNRIYKNMKGVRLLNPESCEIPNQKKKETTSQYKGVYQIKKSGKWYVLFFPKGKKPKYGGVFNDELDAAKKFDQLCNEHGIPHNNHETGTIAKRQRKEKSSQYKGVCWHKENKKWVVKLNLKGQTQTYAGAFNDELDGAKRVNQLCIELGIPEKNPGINGMPNQQWQAKEKTSHYKGVISRKNNKKWHVVLRAKDGKMKYGGGFSDELDAAKRVNQLCEKLEIPEKNPGIGRIPHRPWQPKEKTSQYKGVHWNKNNKKWRAGLRSKDGKIKYGGSFSTELDAAKTVNQLCEELGIPEKNPGIGTIPHLQCQPKEKTSQYKGVSWHQKRRKWCVVLYLKDGKIKYGGRFSDELDAAKRVNQLCEEMGIPEKNPGIGTILHRPWKVKEKTSQYKGVFFRQKCKKWHVSLPSKDGKSKFGGSFSDELDAAERVNQLCREWGIPEKNPEIETISHRQAQHSDNQTIESKVTNSVIGSDTAKTDDGDGTKEKKRKRNKNKSPITGKQYYFYDEMLK